MITVYNRNIQRWDKDKTIMFDMILNLTQVRKIKEGGKILLRDDDFFNKLNHKLWIIYLNLYYNKANFSYYFLDLSCLISTLWFKKPNAQQSLSTIHLQLVCFFLLWKVLLKGFTILNKDIFNILVDVSKHVISVRYDKKVVF